MRKPEHSTGMDVWALPRQLQELTADDPALLPELFAAFREDTTARLERLRAAAAAGDPVRIRAEVHTIKGGSRQIGAAPLAEACHQLELHLGHVPPVSIQDAIEQIELRFAQTCAAMSEYLGRRA